MRTRVLEGPYRAPAATAAHPTQVRGKRRRNKLDHYAVIKFLLTTESAMKETEDNNTLMFIVDVKTNKHQIKQAVKKLCDMDVATVNTLISLLERRRHMFNCLLIMML
ncbi:hypothetical protein H8959_019814 [Pygathrix nigripes]